MSAVNRRDKKLAVSVELVERAADPLVDLVREWTAGFDRQDALIKTWQDAEHRLFATAKALGLALEAEALSKLPQARIMRPLTQQIRAADRKLARLARKIAVTPSTSLAGALAKLEMATRMRMPSGDDEQAWELVDEAKAHLRRILPGRADHPSPAA